MSRQFATFTVLASALTFAGVWTLSGTDTGQSKVLAVTSPPAEAATSITTKAAASPAKASSVYYAGCNDARAAGAAPIHVGEPGYRTEMDGDGDGVACEPRPDAGSSFDEDDGDGSFGGSRRHR